MVLRRIVPQAAGACLAPLALLPCWDYAPQPNAFSLLFPRNLCVSLPNQSQAPASKHQSRFFSLGCLAASVACSVTGVTGSLQVTQMHASERTSLRCCLTLRDCDWRSGGALGEGRAGMRETSTVTRGIITARARAVTFARLYTKEEGEPELHLEIQRAGAAFHVNASYSCTRCSSVATLGVSTLSRSPPPPHFSHPSGGEEGCSGREDFPQRSPKPKGRYPSMLPAPAPARNYALGTQVTMPVAAGLISLRGGMGRFGTRLHPSSSAWDVAVPSEAGLALIVTLKDKYYKACTQENDMEIAPVLRNGDSYSTEMYLIQFEIHSLRNLDSICLPGAEAALSRRILNVTFLVLLVHVDTEDLLLDFPEDTSILHRAQVRYSIVSFIPWQFGPGQCEPHVAVAVTSVDPCGDIKDEMNFCVLGYVYYERIVTQQPHRDQILDGLPLPPGTCVTALFTQKSHYSPSADIADDVEVPARACSLARQSLQGLLVSGAVLRAGIWEPAAFVPSPLSSRSLPKSVSDREEGSAGGAQGSDQLSACLAPAVSATWRKASVRAGRIQQPFETFLLCITRKGVEKGERMEGYINESRCGRAEVTIQHIASFIPADTDLRWSNIWVLLKYPFKDSVSSNSGHQSSSGTVIDFFATSQKHLRRLLSHALLQKVKYFLPFCTAIGELLQGVAKVHNCEGHWQDQAVARSHFFVGKGLCVMQCKKRGQGTAVVLLPAPGLLSDSQGRLQQSVVETSTEQGTGDTHVHAFSTFLGDVVCSEYL
ncbi:hypothetical protein Anapl_14978 [Anas platyrhynchos]|uniref:Uncharacterized protein n=1 Tax=Anas platyrhynchos TaxID=8839 RepID=R0M3M2_ANAPL|nr:hypothetical protein Anapl_14978 [Anas platyrhynchos]